VQSEKDPLSEVHETIPGSDMNLNRILAPGKDYSWIVFIIDDSLDYLENIERLLKNDLLCSIDAY